MWLKHRFELYYLPSSLYLIFFVSTKLKKFSSKLNNCTLGYHQCHLIASIKQQFHLSRIDLHWLYFSKTFPKQNYKRNFNRWDDDCLPFVSPPNTINADQCFWYQRKWHVRFDKIWKHPAVLFVLTWLGKNEIVSSDHFWREIS